MTGATRSGFTAEPNVTPMIDVLLVMLIVFMVAMVRMHHTIDTQLPQPCTGSCDGSTQVVLEVLPEHRYRVNQMLIPPRELLARLQSIYSQRPEKIIEVAGRPGVRYMDVVAAMDVAMSAGVTVIRIAPKSSR